MKWYVPRQYLIFHLSPLILIHLYIFKCNMNFLKVVTSKRLGDLFQKVSMIKNHLFLNNLVVWKLVIYFLSSNLSWEASYLLLCPGWPESNLLPDVSSSRCCPIPGKSSRWMSGMISVIVIAPLWNYIIRNIVSVFLYNK